MRKIIASVLAAISLSVATAAHAAPARVIDTHLNYWPTTSGYDGNRGYVITTPEGDKTIVHGAWQYPDGHVVYSLRVYAQALGYKVGYYPGIVIDHMRQGEAGANNTQGCTDNSMQGVIYISPTIPMFIVDGDYLYAIVDGEEKTYRYDLIGDRICLPEQDIREILGLDAERGGDR